MKLKIRENTGLRQMIEPNVNNTGQAVMPDCQGVGESLIYSKRAKKSTFAGFVPQSGITAVRIVVVYRSGHR